MAGSEIVYQGFVTIERDDRGYETVRTRGNTVAFLVYVRGREEVIFIRQPRPPMVRPDCPEGMVLDVPGERLDTPELSIAGHVLRGARDEIGVAIAHEQDVRILNGGHPIAASPGLVTELTYLAFAEVDGSQVDAEDRTFGLASEGERIQRIFVPVRELPGLTIETIAAWGLVQWFLRQRRE